MIAAGKRPARGVVGVRSAPAGLSAEGAGVCRWREVSEARVGPHLVKVPPPGFQLGAGVRQGAEQGLVQQFVAQLAVEALAEAVLLGLAGGDVMPADLALVGPFQDGVGRQFRAVVADDRRRLAAPADDRVQRARDASPADRGVGHQRQTLAGAVVVHLQDPEPAPVGELVGDEVETPALVGDRGCLYRPPRSHGPLAPAALANHQPLLAIQTLNALFVDRMALAPQQHMQPPIAEPPPLLGQGLQPLAKFAVILPPGLVAHAGPIAVDHPARPPLAHLIGLLQISRSLPMRGGRHHFFPSRSFNATLSSMASASIRFSLAFSSSNAFSRRASDTSRPPYLAFHL